MNIHAIVDYSFLYYKYKFQLDSGKMRRLTTAMEWKGAVIEKDISQIYYSIKEIEGFRRKLEQAGHTVFVSVCFDMPSGRKTAADDATDSEIEAASKYKSNRVKRLSDEDFENIRFVEGLLARAGYNTYRLEHFEGDDLVTHLAQEYKQEFDYSIIYTNDLDLLVNIGPKVGACRYKAMKGYTNVDMNNFSSYIGAEAKAEMPYNALMLYKATVGDSSDCIEGIKKFGPKAFDKLVAHLTSKGIEWELMGDWRVVEGVLNGLGIEGYLTEEKLTQALNSLSLVRAKVADEGMITPPTKHSTRELRQEVYMQYAMQSLVD